MDKNIRMEGPSGISNTVQIYNPCDRGGKVMTPSLWAKLSMSWRQKNYMARPITDAQYLFPSDLAFFYPSMCLRNLLPKRLQNTN